MARHDRGTGNRPAGRVPLPLCITGAVSPYHFNPATAVHDRGGSALRIAERTAGGHESHCQGSLSIGWHCDYLRKDIVRYIIVARIAKAVFKVENRVFLSGFLSDERAFGKGWSILGKRAFAER